jgi:hypothetical protein
MANWSRAFDELGTGLLRQADIGGRAYEGAMAKEAEQRAANRALAAEGRALQQRLAAEKRLETATIRAEGRREEITERAETRQEATTKRTEGRALTDWRIMAGESATANLQAREDEIRLSGEEWDRQFKVKNDAAVKASLDKAGIEALKDIYDKRMDSYTTLMEKFGDDPSSPGFKQAYRAQEAVIQAWQDYTAASGLKMREHPEISRLRLKTVEAVFAEIVSADLQHDGPWKDFVTALELGYGPGNEPNKASEDALKTINDAIERLGIILPEDEKSEMIDDLVKVFLASPDIREGTVTIGDGTDKGDEPTHDITEAMGEPATIPSSKEVMATLSLNVPPGELPALMERANVAMLEADERGAKIEEYLKSYLQSNGIEVDVLDIRKYIVSGANALRDSATGMIHPLTPEIGKHLNRYRDAWKDNSLLRGKIGVLLRRIKQRTGGMGLNIEPTAAVDDTPRGILNEGGRGMIAAVDQGISPQEFAYWEPDATDARAKSMQRTV